MSVPKDALAPVSCDKNSDAGGPLSATYTLVENKAALDAALNGIVQVSTRVNCPGNVHPLGPWWYRNQARCTCGWIGKASLLLSSAKVDALLHAARDDCEPAIPLFQPGSNCANQAGRSLGRQPHKLTSRTTDERVLVADVPGRT